MRGAQSSSRQQQQQQQIKPTLILDKENGREHMFSNFAVAMLLHKSIKAIKALCRRGTEQRKGDGHFHVDSAHCLTVSKEISQKTTLTLRQCQSKVQLPTSLKRRVKRQCLLMVLTYCGDP